MFSHVVAIEGGKAKITWEDKKLKSVMIDFDEALEVDPMCKVFDLRPELSRYLQGLNVMHEKTAEFLKAAGTIQDMTLDQVPKEVRHMLAMGPGPVSDKEGFEKYKQNMAAQAKNQILEIKEKTKVHGERLRIKKVLRKSGCKCEDALCYILKKGDGTHWWRCKECGEEVRAKRADVTERQVIFMMEEVEH